MRGMMYLCPHLPCNYRRCWAKAGGETGIRTLGTLASSLVFETSLFNHSSTSPRPGGKRADLYWLREDFNSLKSSEDHI